MKICQTLELKHDPELIKEYKAWHSTGKIWKEIPEGIRAVGIKEMEIFLWQNRLVMIVEVDDDFDWEGQMKKLAILPKQKEWEELMDKFQQRLNPQKPEEKWQPMEKIFQLTQCK